MRGVGARADTSFQCRYFMLPREKRVGKDLFLSVFKEGRSFHSPNLLLKVLYQGGRGNFSMVAQKGAAKGAVERNRLRRQGYWALEKMKGKLKPGAVSIFFIKKKVSFSQLEQEIIFLLGKAGLLA